MGAVMDSDMKSGARMLWSWLRGASWPIHRGSDDRRGFSTGVTAQPSSVRTAPEREPAAALPNAVLQSAISQVVGLERTARGGVILQFPLHGEALLVKLAETLRSRIVVSPARRGTECDPFLLTMSRCPGSRLSIDARAHVEFDAGLSVYRMTIEAAPDTMVTLNTTDFDTLVNFVVQYIAERLSTPATLEVAS
jgi:hypothetical protein